jgi:TRAP-type C4-dicarboxylate transport system permease small subunit
MDGIFGYIKNFEHWIMVPIFVAALFAAFVVAIVEVVLRYVYGLSIQWQADFVVFSILSASFLHLGITERANSHLRMTVLFELVAKRFRVAAGIIRGLANVAVLFYLGFFVYHGVAMTQFGRDIGRMVQSRLFPVWPFYGVMVLGHVLLAVWIAYRLFADLRALVRGDAYSEELLGGEEGIALEGDLAE